MLQDIAPHIYHSEYKTREPEEGDIIIFQNQGRILMKSDENASRYTLPEAGQIKRTFSEVPAPVCYLFSIDDQGFFLSQADIELFCGCGFSWRSVMTLREMENDFHAFGGAVGWQLANWYDHHRICGRCGCKTQHSADERAIVCPECKTVYYPRISPVVIIAITDGDRILLTRYNRSGYRRHALVAGFVEIGETLEDAVRREVMEEVGLKVKDIRYIESQPWPFSSSLIAGFAACVDGDPAVHLNTDGGEELAEAVWMRRDEVVIEDSSVSLTWDMIRRFKDGVL